MKFVLFFIVNLNLVWYASQTNPQFARVHQNTERSHLVAIINNSNYSKAKGHSSFVSVAETCGLMASLIPGFYGVAPLLPRSALRFA